jgi:hypothetical protein
MPDGTVLVSSMGWVDHDALWRFDVPASRADLLSLGTGAQYLSVHASGADLFSVVHHFEGARVEVTVHGFADPPAVLARATVGEGQRRVAGDASVWARVPRLYVEYLDFAAWKDFVLLKIVPAAERVEIRRLEWYDETYDKSAQGVVGVLELPGEEVALVSVQRSSVLILHDLERGRKAGAVDLGGRGGNPMLRLGKAGDEVWASDYDTLVVLERDGWWIARRARLQGGARGMPQFIGDYSLAADGRSCVVARPLSGDAVSVDAATLRVRHAARLGRQPLEVAAPPGGRGRGARLADGRSPARRAEASLVVPREGLTPIGLTPVRPTRRPAERSR